MVNYLNGWIPHWCNTDFAEVVRFYNDKLNQIFDYVMELNRDNCIVNDDVGDFIMRSLI